MEEILNILEGFNHQSDIHIAGMEEKHVEEGTQAHPPVVAALEAAGLYPTHEYIQRRQTTIAAKTEYRPIYELCTKAYQRPGMSRMMRCWDQILVQKYE